jgi:hypothetical protein
MRRVLVALVLVATSVLTSAPATASPARPSLAERYAALDASFAANTKAAMESAGWTTLAAHNDGYWEGRVAWFNEANGRFYILRGWITTVHDPATQEWWVRYNIWCRRAYGNLEVDNYCNIDVDGFRAMGFTTSTGETRTIYGEKNPGDTTCGFNNSDTGVKRFIDDLYPWKLAFITYVKARWWTGSSCSTSVHLSETRELGSYRANHFSESIVKDQFRTGWGIAP